ncbi:MAG: M14 family metallopeptidase [Bdellovibrionales bacterium]
MESISSLLIGLFLSTQQQWARLSPYEQVVQALQKIEAENPNTSRLIQVGISDSGQPIVGIQIGRGGKANLLVATHHGNEYGSTAVAVAAANAFAQAPLQGQTLYVIPVLNISGYNSRNRFERNSRGQSFDPNRDYTGPCKSGPTFNLKSTLSLAKFVDQAQIVTSATLHTYMPGVLYPWGLSTRDVMTADTEEYIRLGKAAAAQSGYTVGNSTELLYAADGTFEDFAYWQFGVWSLLFEMGTTHNPNENQIKEMIRGNLPGFRRYFLESPSTRSTNHAFTGRCDNFVRQRQKME